MLTVRLHLDKALWLVFMNCSVKEHQIRASPILNSRK